ncbi:hypothetical protein CPC08DRAFT_510730 [Agrocybe pediades]|nr:hypothetical protein CPC08DRAFT_510730 [Agrocybe pediades]
MRDCGWADEIEKMDDEDMKRLRRRQDIGQASRSPVTSEVYASLEIALNQALLEIQEERLNRERCVFLKRSFVVQEAAVRIYSAALPGNSIFPTVADVYFHPRVQEMFNNAASTDVFTIDTFPGIQQMAKDWRKDADNKLREMVLEAVPSIKSPSHCDLLNLAAIAFKCSACLECFGPRTYPRVLMHKCARMAEETMFHGDAAEMLLTNKYCCVPWNINGRISFDLRAYRIIEKTVIDCGLSPDITTCSNMDKERHVFQCMPCSNSRQGFAVMTWDMMVVHLMSTRHDFVLDLSHIRRISESESVYFTRKIQERYDRWHTDPFSLALVCIRCKSYGNLLSLGSHLPANVPADHGSSPVCHVVPVLDSMTAPPICWAQPEQDMGTPCLD